MGERTHHRHVLPVAVHVVPEYLPREATYIYTLLRFQQNFRSVVLARSLNNLAEFPIDDLHQISPAEDETLWRASERLLEFGKHRRSHVSHGVEAIARRLDKYFYGQRLKIEARDRRASILHAHHGWSGRDCVAAARRLRVPLVTTFYGRDVSEPERARRGFSPYRRLFGQGTSFLCEGPTMARHLAELGCPEDRIRIIKIGLDLSQFDFVPALRSPPLILIQVGRLVEKKGVDVSLRAYAATRDRLGPSEFWVVGDGPLRSELERLAGELGIAQSVHFLGMVSHARYRALVRSAHICLQPSRTAKDGDTEGGAPTVLLEMQATGIPVVASRHADIPTVVANPGELVDEEDVQGFGEIILRLAKTSEDDWQDRVRRGRALVESQHDALLIAAQVERLYSEALRLQRGGGGTTGRQ